MSKHHVPTRATTVSRLCYVSDCHGLAVAQIRWRFTTGEERTRQYCAEHVEAITERIAPNLPAGVVAVEVMSV